MTPRRAIPVQRRAARRCRAMTYIEMMISMGIGSLIMVVIVSLQSASGRAIKEMYGQTRTRSARMIALDQIRYRLVDARAGTLTFSQANPDGSGFHQVDFIDPNLGGVTSRFQFDPATVTLTYDSNIADGTAPQSVIRGPIDVSFEPQNAGAIVVIRTRSSAIMSPGDVDIQDGQTIVYLRNV